MKFSERHFAEKEFEKWCKSTKSTTGFTIANCASSVLAWLEDTPEGQKIVKQLYNEISE